MLSQRSYGGPWCPQDLKADALFFKEPPLVGAQHSANKADALVCSRCFSMIGSIEQQIAHRLLASEESGGPHSWHCNCREKHAPAIAAKAMQIDI